ncbi:MAG: sulfotransferase domain-containing protein [Coleofasciculus sp. G3-WIS-01]|uniref:sulfotransferase domain-containing protein n=1 Tax=Coleofasciculus sp. G3-WIS-01 TaxID=3069528 RepID=UPI0032F9ACE3
MKSPLLAYFGHHKAATTWLSNIVRNICAEVNWKACYVSNAKMFDFKLNEFVHQNKVDFLCYTNANFKYVKELDNFRGFHVIRDPRDVLVSGYFSHRYSHPTNRWSELVEHRSKLENLSKEEGLLLEIEFSKRFLEEMYTWDYSLSNVYEIKMENLVNDPYNEIIQACYFLGIVNEPTFKERFSYLTAMFLNRALEKSGKFSFSMSMNKIPEERLLRLIYKNQFPRKSKGRNQGKEDKKSHYRKGVAGDWKNHFNQEHTRVFKNKYNQILIKLGYEEDDNW